ncbi:MAG: hypothetical protein Q9182_007387 [Xanthomendoza sp. 2 TL-2023]
MKKLFHRKKNSAPNSPEQTPVHPRPHGDANNGPSLRTSRYESTTSAGLPQTGQYPLRGNNSSLALQGRRSETYSRGQTTGGVEPSPRPSTSNQYYGSLPTPPVTSASYDYESTGRPLTDGPSEVGHASNYQQPQRASQSSLAIQDFSNLNLNSHSDGRQGQHFNAPQSRHHERSGLIHGGQDPNQPSTRHERRGYGANYTPETRIVGRTETLQSEVDFHRQTGEYDRMADHGSRDHHTSRYHFAQEPSDDALGYPPETYPTGTGNRPIVRKQIAQQHPAAAHQEGSRSSILEDRTRYHPASLARASQPEDSYGKHTERTSQARSNLDRSPRSNAPVDHPSAQEVVDRARGITYDTEVIEKVAPAVVHERVHEDVHHIREEHITKEVHNHDVFHRILPIIDVEVLPPRHFLPVEGGGLVEISSKEVPGRGNNWVIAETASKIPSDQPASKSVRPFSARQFIGTEGDAVNYKMSGGYERTEQTWVHPPELETGGRDTGQTWPMEFGNEKPAKSPRTKSSKAKNSRNPGEPHSSRMQANA